MSNIPSKLRFASSHEWARLERDGTISVGISKHAQDMLGDIVAIELPVVGQVYDAGDQVAVVESIKTASDIHCPVSGAIVVINTELASNPAELNESPYEQWLFKIYPDDVVEMSLLLSADDYARVVVGE